MLQLHIQNTPVDLESTASIALSFSCPAFDGDSVERAWSLPFRLPLSAKNRLLFKNLNRLDTRSLADNLAATVVGDGQDLATGVYQIETATQSLLDGHFENKPLAGLKGLGNLKLQNLLRGAIPIPQTSALPRWYLEIKPPNVASGYSIKIDDRFFGQSTASDLATAINTQFGETFAVPASATLVILSPPSDGRSLKIENSSSGGFVNGINLLPTSRTAIGAQRENFLYFVRETFTEPRADMSFSMMGNKQLYEGKNADWSGLINFAQKVDGQWEVGFSRGAQYSEKTEDATAWKYTYVPFVRVSFVLQKIGEKLGVSVVTGLFAEWAELSTLVIYNNSSLDDVQPAFEFDVWRWTNGYATAIDLANHVPDMTAREFLSQFCSTFNLWWQVKDGRLIFRKKIKILRGAAVSNWGQYIVPSTIERTYKTANGVRLRLQEDETDAATSAALNPYVEGNGGEEIALPTGALPEKEIAHLLFSCFSEQVRTEAVGVLRFMFDRGEKNYGLGWYQQLACSATGGTLSILPSDLWAWAWKESGEYQAYGWTLTASFELPLSETNRALRWDNCLRRLDTPFGSVVGAIAKVDVTEAVKGKAVVKVEFWVKN